MVIIIEGIDRVGKTTLSEMIEERYRDFMDFIRFRDDTRYVHNHLNKAVNTEKINTLQNLLEAGLVDNIILDRYHITEFVYGAIERSYKNEDMYDIDKPEDLLQQRWYGPDGKNLWERDWKHDDSHHNHTFPHDHFWNWSKPPFRFDYKGAHGEKTIILIVKRSKK